MKKENMTDDYINQRIAAIQKMLNQSDFVALGFEMDLDFKDEIQLLKEDPELEVDIRNYPSIRRQKIIIRLRK